jgi:hypothetical protein
MIRLTVVLLVSMLGACAGTGSTREAPQPMTLGEFSKFTQEYFRTPQPERIESAMLFLDHSPLARETRTQVLITMSFSCITHRPELKQRSWEQAINSLHYPASALMKVAVTTEPDALVSGIPLSPQQNDMNWACFFGTGDTSYLDRIVAATSHSSERKDMNAFLAAASAKWSLASNAAHYQEVRTYVEGLRSNKQYDAMAKEILESDPASIQAETTRIIAEQHRKGIW